jgi:hypothetical protein
MRLEDEQLSLGHKKKGLEDELSLEDELMLLEYELVNLNKHS